MNQQLANQLKGKTMKTWRDHIQHRTGEVSVIPVAESLGVSVDAVMRFVKDRHGARYVGGTSQHLIWKEDAALMEQTPILDENSYSEKDARFNKDLLNATEKP